MQIVAPSVHADPLTPVVFSASTTLSSDVFCSDLTINPGVTLITAGHSIYCTETFNNQGTIETGTTQPGDFPHSYGGSGGGAQSMLCNAGTGAGFSTIASGGAGNSVNHVPTQGGSTPQAPDLSSHLLRRWFTEGMAGFLSGAGGQTVCGDIAGGAGGHGIYIQANRIIAGTILANSQMGTGTCSGQGLSGSGGGGVLILSFGDGGYTSGTYKVDGGQSVPSCDGLSFSGSGGNGQVLTFSYERHPPVPIRLSPEDGSLQVSLLSLAP